MVDGRMVRTLRRRGLRRPHVRLPMFDMINLSALLLFTASILYPFLYMFSVSISDPEAVALHRVVLWPVGRLTLEAYRSVLTSNDVLSAYWNSVLYTATGTLLTVAVASLAGYVLINRFKLRTFLTMFFLATMFIHPGLIPNFLNMKYLGLLDTMWAIVLPSAFWMWYIILARTNFMQIPRSLFESAHLDGANEWYILFRIVLPLSTAILATVAIFSAIGYWNNYVGPLIYLTDPKKFPLPIILRNILIARENIAGSADSVDTALSEQGGLKYIGGFESLRLATIFVTIGPIILIYPFAQKYFVKGVMIGSVKG